MTETPETVSDVVARRVRELRDQWGWSAAELAEHCAEWGHPELTASVIANIESGRRDKSGRRRRDVTVDEAAAFARVLQVPVHELIYPEAPMVSARELVEWLRHQYIVEKELDDGRMVVRRDPVPIGEEQRATRRRRRSDG
jgi:transcriptional regulator with XRE-family HTH domain